MKYVARVRGFFRSQLIEAGQEFEAEEGAIKAPKDSKREPWAVPAGEYEADEKLTPEDEAKRAREGLQGSPKGKGVPTEPDPRVGGGEAGDPTEGKDDGVSEETPGTTSRKTPSAKKASKKKSRK